MTGLSVVLGMVALAQAQSVPVASALRAGGGPVVPKKEGETPAPSPAWEARFTRDQLGLEIERSLPGGVRARWERDNVGRPLKHEVWSGKEMLHRHARRARPAGVCSEASRSGAAIPARRPARRS